MLTTRRIATLPNTITLAPQQMLAGLRWLVVGAASVLNLHNGMSQHDLLRNVIVIGGLLGQQSFTLWLATFKLEAFYERWLLMMNLIFISLATALLGPAADTLFLLYLLLVVEAAIILTAEQTLGYTVVVSVAYVLTHIVALPGGVAAWLARGWMLTLLEILLFFIVMAIGMNLVSAWTAKHEHIIQLALLDELSLLLADTRRLDDVLVRLVELVPQALNVQACVVAIDEPGSDRRIWANLGADTSALIDEALLTHESVAVRKSQHNMARAPLPGSPYAAVYALPLEIDDRSVGVLSVARVTPAPFTERDRRIFESLARHAAQSLRNARLYKLESEAASQSRELEHFKSEMLASVSHEFRLPLASITLATETLIAREVGRETDAADMSMRLLYNIQRSTHRLNSFVQDVLDVARLEAHQLELRFQPCDLMALARGALSLVEPQCEAKQQQLRCESEMTTCTVHGDSKRLEQVISNLLTNAQQYTPEGGEIVLTLAPAELINTQNPCGAEAAGASVTLSVRDTGPGISIAERGQIFERFNRGDAGRRRSAGAGLGLHIARSVVELHGGYMWVTGNAAGGSTFWCVLPVAGPARDTDTGSLPRVSAPMTGEHDRVPREKTAVETGDIR